MSRRSFGKTQSYRRTSAPKTKNFQLKNLPKVTHECVWAVYSAINRNYLAIATVFLVVILSFILPDLSEKFHRNSELKSMKNFLDVMSKEVSRAEVACITVTNDMCDLQRSMHEKTTETVKDDRDISVCTSKCMRITQSEPMHANKRTGFLRRLFHPNKNTSHKEVAIMSYIYTDSFDANKKLVDTNILYSLLD